MAADDRFCQRPDQPGVTATGPNRVKQGDTIEVTFNPALSGATIGFLRSIVLPNKKEVEFVPN